jgi:hypothetical protein
MIIRLLAIVGLVIDLVEFISLAITRVDDI